MVPHEIEPAERICRAPYDRSGEIVLTQIADEPERPAASCRDRSDRSVDARLIDLNNADGRTLRAREAKKIRIKLLRFLDSRPEKQAITGERKLIGNDFRHQRGSAANKADT
jgi:hypothetical protein